jgi:hypothetical protein
MMKSWDGICWLITASGSIAEVGGALSLVGALVSARRAAASSRARAPAAPSDPDPQPLDPPRIGIEHLDLEIAGPAMTAAHRQAADLRHG